MALEDSTPADATEEAPAEASDAVAAPAEGGAPVEGTEGQEEGKEGEPKAKEPEAKKPPGFKAIQRATKRLQAREAKADETDRNLRAQVERLTPRLAKLEAFEKHEGLLKSDPIAFLEAHGVSLEELVDKANGRFLKDNSPDAAVQRARDEAAAVRKELEDFKAENTKAQQQRALAQTEADMMACVGKVDPATQAPLFPASVKFAKVFGRHELLGASHGLAAEMKAAGIVPTYESVAAGLEERAAAFLAEREISFAHGGASQTPSPLTGTGPGTPGQPLAKPPSRTLSNRDAAESSGGERELDDEESRRVALEILRRGRRKAGLDPAGSARKRGFRG